MSNMQMQPYNPFTGKTVSKKNPRRELIDINPAPEAIPRIEAIMDEQGTNMGFIEDAPDVFMGLIEDAPDVLNEARIHEYDDAEVREAILEARMLQDAGGQAENLVVEQPTVKVSKSRTSNRSYYGNPDNFRSNFTTRQKSLTFKQKCMNLNESRAALLRSGRLNDEYLNIRIREVGAGGETHAICEIDGRVFDWNDSIDFKLPVNHILRNRSCQSHHDLTGWDSHEMGLCTVWAVSVARIYGALHTLTKSKCSSMSKLINYLMTYDSQSVIVTAFPFLQHDDIKPFM